MGSTSPAVCRVGKSAAEAGAWQAGVQQSIFILSDVLDGILPSIVHPAMSLDGAADVFAATGEIASPRAHTIDRSSRITPGRINRKAYLSMNVTFPAPRTRLCPRLVHLLPGFDHPFTLRRETG